MALLTARFMNIKSLELEGDNKTVMESLAGSKDCPFWTVIPLYNSVLDLAKEFDVVKFLWCCRTVNSVADNLCKWATFSEDFVFVRTGKFPPVRNALKFDCLK